MIGRPSTSFSASSQSRHSASTAPMATRSPISGCDRPTTAPRRASTRPSFRSAIEPHDVRVSLPLQPAGLRLHDPDRARRVRRRADAPPSQPWAGHQRPVHGERALRRHRDAQRLAHGRSTSARPRSTSVCSPSRTAPTSATAGITAWRSMMRVFTSTASNAAVALVHDGPNLTTFRIRTTMQVPKRFTFGDTMARSEELVDLVIESCVSLRPGAEDSRSRDGRPQRSRGPQAARAASRPTWRRRPIWRIRRSMWWSGPSP